MLGVPSIALSQGYGPGDRTNIHWDCAITHGPRLIQKILDIGIPKNILVNVNFPNLPADQINGTVVTAQGRRASDMLRLEERADGRGIPYYWIGFNAKRSTPANGTDLAALAAGKISVTPLRMDLTDEPTLTHYAASFD